MRIVTGERVTTARGGFNPTWQRHVAAYQLCAPMLVKGRVLDLGCGVGHTASALPGSFGVDLDHASLVAQARPTVVADMRQLPFCSSSVDAVLSVQSLEHVPDADRVIGAVRAALRPGGVAVFVTPNRLTFARPDEVIDPYHYVEFDAAELAALCSTSFGSVRVLGFFGSARYLELVAEEQRQLARLLRLDPMRARRLVPRRTRQRLYDWMLSRKRRIDDPRSLVIEPADFRLENSPLDDALDLVAVCR